MTRRVATLLFLMLAGAALIVGRPDAAQRPKPAGAEFKGEAFRFNKIQEGIYHAVGTGAICRRLQCHDLSSTTRTC